MAVTGARPRILLVEDDAVSRAYLHEVLASRHAVIAADGATAALAAARQAGDFDLWLLDAHLPDGDGLALLRDLRALAASTPALAHTADPDPRRAARLREGGFDGVLRKPVSPRALREGVQRALGHGGRAVAEAPAPPWAPRLRQLFLDELPGQCRVLARARRRGDLAAMQPVLHRLRGSCALVGARELEACVRALQAAPGSGSAWIAFARVVRAVLGVQDAAEVGQQVP